MSDEDLQRELGYYKRHLDELAAQRISIEHHQWALQMQLRHKKQGFQLLSRLALSLGAHPEIGSMFRVAVLAINSALEMDRTSDFRPDRKRRPLHGSLLRGRAGRATRKHRQTVIELPAELATGCGLLLVNRPSPETPLITRLRELFGVETFVCVPVMGHRGPLGIIFSGRIGGHSSLFRALDDGDVDTFRAISGILQAITQHTRLALLEQTERLKADFPRMSLTSFARHSLSHSGRSAKSWPASGETFRSQSGGVWKSWSEIRSACSD